MKLRTYYRVARKKVLFLINSFFSKLQHGKKIAIIESDKWLGRVYDDLLLQKTLIMHGMRAEIISWQNSDNDYGQYDALVVGAMWGYQNYLKDFEDWAARVKKSDTVIINDLDIICHNYDKVAQNKILERSRIPHIDTSIISNLEELVRIRDYPAVIKPSISGGGEGVVLIRSTAELNQNKKHLERYLVSGKLLVQPYVPEVMDGEISVVVIDGEISYAVRRFTGVIEGKYRAQRTRLSRKMRETVYKVVKLPEYQNCAYMRVDMVFVGGEYLIMEVECFEPQLFYYLLHGKSRTKALSRMVKAIERRLA